MSRRLNEGAQRTVSVAEANRPRRVLSHGLFWDVLACGHRAAAEVDARGRRTRPAERRCALCLEMAQRKAAPVAAAEPETDDGA